MSISLTPSPTPVEVPLATRGPAPANNLANVERETEDEVFLLPGGHVDESGRLHDEVQLSPLTGLDEYLLASLDPGSCAASVVTALLARCVKRVGSLESIDASLIRQLLVADRDYLIVKLRLLTLGPRVDCVLHCPNPDCDKLMDLTFDLNQMEFERKPVKQRYITIQLLPGAAEGTEPERFTGSVEIRLPNGADQEVCASLFSINKEAALAELLSRCILRIDNCAIVDEAKVSGLNPEERLEIEERLGQLAPNADIEIEASCPECEKSLGATFDVLTFLLKELMSSFRSLEHDVHYLAWHYHWSEREILAMTRRKRRRYVALVQEEVDRLNQVW